MNGRPAKGRKPTKKEATIKEKLLRSKLLNVAKTKAYIIRLSLHATFRKD